MMENSEAAAQRDRRVDALGDLRVLPDEILCSILEQLTPRDAARLACVSSVMYLLCNEEPLWMILCLRGASGLLQYQGSWKKTALHNENVLDKYKECQRQLYFDGFNSLFLYRRLYRCHTTLEAFHADNGSVERIKDISLKDFSDQYDAKKPVMLTGLADTWPARDKWTTGQLLLNYGDVAFKLSQRSSGKIKMKLKDYVSYTKVQHDEDPLYIFDEKFGEVAPGLLKDYSVPHLFQEDFFDNLDTDKRPSYRWLIIGPERSGASWHVDPALTSAWNTLLTGRKRWALYPPGKVPLGVTVHVNEEDGDVSVDTPSSLQWWLDFYPLLADEDKPIECTQLPGETIYVPSGWWHCVLNLETTIAVTQNFVNSNNFEFVCLDMAPGYRHKGVCRAGLLALDEDTYEDRQNMACNESYSDLSRKEKRAKTNGDVDDLNYESTVNGASRSYNLWKDGFSYDINFLSMFLDRERDHYSSLWSSGNSIGQRELREWLSKLWIQKPEMRELIWKGACIALNAEMWLGCLSKICAAHNLPPPTDDERLPLGTGSNPVYIVGNSVVKIFAEGGLEASLYGLGTELECYSLLHEINSPLKKHIPSILASGIVYLEEGSFNNLTWDGKGVPSVIAESNFISMENDIDGFSFGLWGKKQLEYRNAGMPVDGSVSLAGHSSIWPYMITKRCEGKMFAELRDSLSWEDVTNLASFLGEQLSHLHLLPHPPLNISSFTDIEHKFNFPETNGCVATVNYKSNTAAEWGVFIKTLIRKRKDVSSRLTKWGDPIPSNLIEKVDEYMQPDFATLLNLTENFPNGACKPCTWIHTDIMDDNIYMEPSLVCSTSSGNTEDAALGDNGFFSSYDEVKSWGPSYILDFSNLSIGDPIFDFIPIYLDVFRGDSDLFKRFLQSYKLPFASHMTKHESPEGGQKFARLSYVAMCYCILHDDNVLGAIFSIWKELRSAKSWEEVELRVWGELNNYNGFP